MQSLHPHPYGFVMTDMYLGLASMFLHNAYVAEATLAAG